MTSEKQTNKQKTFNRIPDCVEEGKQFDEGLCVAIKLFNTFCSSLEEKEEEEEANSISYTFTILSFWLAKSIVVYY